MFNLSKATLKERQDFIKNTSESLAKLYKEVSYRAVTDKWNSILSQNRICGFDQTVISDKFWAIVFN